MTVCKASLLPLCSLGSVLVVCLPFLSSGSSLAPVTKAIPSVGYTAGQCLGAFPSEVMGI